MAGTSQPQLHVTEDEVLRLLHAVGSSHRTAPKADRRALAARDRALVGLLYFLALKGSDALALRREDVDASSASVRFRNTETEKLDVPLGQAPALRPLLQDWEIALEAWHPETRDLREHYLVTRPGKALRPEYVKKMLDSATKAAGIQKKVTPTSLRDSRAWHLLQEGVDPEEVKQLLRWRTEETWPRYLRRLESRSEASAPASARSAQELEARIAELESALEATRLQVEALSERMSSGATDQKRCNE